MPRSVPCPWIAGKRGEELVPTARHTSSMRTSSLPARPRRRFSFASTIVPQAIAPFGITTRPFTLTSSATSKSTLLPVASLAEESSRASFSGTGVPSSRPKANAGFRLRGGRWTELRSGCGLLGTRSRGLLEFVGSDGLRRAVCRDKIHKASRDEQAEREESLRGIADAGLESERWLS